MKTSQKLLYTAVLSLLVLFSTVGLAEEAKKVDSTATIKAAYPLNYCIVTGEKLGEMGNPVPYTYKGRDLKFCCSGCISTFEKDPQKYLKKIDKAIVAKEKDSYPLKTCVVTGEKLGAMGTPVDYVYNNQLVRFCCKGCVSTFEKNPDKYMAMLAAPTTTTPETK